MTPKACTTQFGSSCTKAAMSRSSRDPRPPSPQEAGKRLNVDAVLTGSVRRADRKVRVNAQLIRTEDGQVLWAEGGLEVESRDLLEAERLLSTAIATRLHVPLSRRERNAMA